MDDGGEDLDFGFFDLRCHMRYFVGKYVDAERFLAGNR